MTFQEAFEKFPFDVERIAELIGMPPHEVDRVINEAMDRQYTQRAKEEKRRLARRDYMRRVRAELRETRARRSA